MFSASKKSAREIAQHLISGHTTLIAFWALRHAGVLAAMESDPLDPIAYAAKTSMSPDILSSLLQYLSHQGLIQLTDGKALLTPLARALLHEEDGALELLRAHQPATQVLEKLLAGLKVSEHGTQHKNDAFTTSQAARHAAEVHPALIAALKKRGATHVLDLGCGTAQFLIALAEKLPKILAVGLAADGHAIRLANNAIVKKNLEKRLIAFNAAPLELAQDARLACDRIGISQQLVNKFDAFVACDLFTPSARRDERALTIALAGIAAQFPRAHFFFAEPCESPRLQKNYYWPELEFLNRLSRAPFLTPESWRSILTRARLKIIHESLLDTDSITLFTCRPA